jgi:hypothetical protein
MLIGQILLGLFALSVPTVGLVVVVRLVWSSYRALRASRFKLAALSALAIACLLGLFLAVVAVWFAYAVGHSKKDIWRDFEMALWTGLPFYAASYAFWRVATYIRSVVGDHAARPGVEADASQAGQR